MKLEMTTDFLSLIDPATYGTDIGETLNEIQDEYIEKYKKTIVDCGIDKINEMLSEDSIIKELGECTAEEGSLKSPRFYNFENDSIEFILNVPDKTIVKMRNENYSDEFFCWADENFGSYSGFISFFPYTKEKFRIAIQKNDLDLSRAVAMIITKIFDEKMGIEEIARNQRDYEESVIETAKRNGWIIYRDEE